MPHEESRRVERRRGGSARERSGRGPEPGARSLEPEAVMRFLFRLVVLAVVVVVVVALYFRYQSGADVVPELPSGGAVDSARQTGAEITERVSEGAVKAGKVLSEATLTSKIKSKMLLDDTLKGSNISVETAGTVVTVTGSVATKAQKQRVLQLAKETAGVTSVVDHVEIKAR